jgi:transcription antitermination factor NusG
MPLDKHNRLCIVVFHASHFYRVVPVLIGDCIPKSGSEAGNKNWELPRMDASNFVLDASPEIFPQLDGEVWLIQTQTRQERALCRRLGTMGFSTYMPVELRRVQRNNGDKNYDEYERLLFPRIVFVGSGGRSDGEVFYGAMDTHLTFVSPETLPTKVKNQKRVRADLNNFEVIRAARQDQMMGRMGQFQKGDRVRVKEGPLMGLTGFIIRGNRNSIAVQLECLEGKTMCSAREIAFSDFSKLEVITEKY